MKARAAFGLRPPRYRLWLYGLIMIIAALLTTLFL